MNVKYLIQLLRDTGLTQAELALKLNISYQFLSHLECDRRTPSYSTLLSIFNLLEKVFPDFDYNKHFKSCK